MSRKEYVLNGKENEIERKIVLNFSLILQLFVVLLDLEVDFP
jgi:hypothetical protein